MRSSKTTSTLTDVAKEAGVSIATASLVLNSGRPTRRVGAACAERVREAAQRLGYVSNQRPRAIRAGRTDQIGVVLEVPYPADRARSELATTYHGSIAASVELAARLAGYHLAVVGPLRDERALDRAIAAIHERRLAGIVVPAPSMARSGRLELLESMFPAPIVLVEHRTPSPLPVVDWNELAGIAMGLQHLAGFGHREILWLGPEWSPAAGQLQPAVPETREQLVMAAAWDAGMRGQSCRYAHRRNLAEDQLMAIVTAADEAMTRMLAAPGRVWTAVVAWNDAAAIGACRALARAGLRVPHDVSVLGFDDVESRLAVPAMTSVGHAFDALGRRAIELLVEMIDDPNACERRRGHREEVLPTLAVRESTGPAPRLPA